MFIRQSRQHDMPDIQRQTETNSERDKQTDRETYRQYCHVVGILAILVYILINFYNA